MAWTILSPFAVGQRLRAAALNLVVTAVQELQTAMTAAQSDITTLKTVKHFMEAARTTNQSVSAATMTTVTMSDVSDAGNNYNGTVYTVPEAGTYMCVSKVRPADGTSTTQSIGSGVHTSNVDGPWFAWDTPKGGGRSTFVNVRIATFAASDQLRLYVYSDSGFTIIQASLVIYRIGS